MSSWNAVSCITELFQRSIRNKAEASWKQQVMLSCLLYFHWAKEQRVNKKFREKMQRLVQNPFSFKISATHWPEALTLSVSLWVVQNSVSICISALWVVLTLCSACASLSNKPGQPEDALLGNIKRAENHSRNTWQGWVSKAFLVVDLWYTQQLQQGKYLS